MPLIPPGDAQKIKAILDKELMGDVHITVLNEPGGGLILPGQPEHPYDEVAELMTDLAGLSAKLKIEQINVRAAPDRMREFGVDKAPALVFDLDGKRNVRFFGFPGGYEFSTLLQTIVQVSKGETGLTSEYIGEINALPGTLHLQVFVTPT